MFITYDNVKKQLMVHHMFIISLLLVFSVIYEPYSYPYILKFFLGVFFSLIFPGLLLTKIIFPKANDILWLPRFGYSIVFSIIILFGCGFILYLANIPINKFNLTILLFALEALAVFIGITHENKILNKELISFSFSFDNNYISSLSFLKENTIKIVSCITALILTISLLFVALNTTDQQFYTEFYVLGQDGSFSSIPNEVNHSISISLILGIKNHEKYRTTYYVNLNFNNSNTSINLITNITLYRGEDFKREIHILTPKDGLIFELKFILSTLEEFNMSSVKLFFFLKSTLPILHLTSLENQSRLTLIDLQFSIMKGDRKNQVTSSKRV